MKSSQILKCVFGHLGHYVSLCLSSTLLQNIFLVLCLYNISFFKRYIYIWKWYGGGVVKQRSTIYKFSKQTKLPFLR